MTDQFDSFEPFDEEQDDGYLSRSEKKRRSTARQKIGEDLARMPLSAIRTFGLPKAVEDAFEEYFKASKHEARRRQMQFIGRLLRDIDTTDIEARLSDYHAGRAAAAADFQHLERLRDDLVQERDGALEDVLEAYPGADLQYLRQLVRNSRKEQTAGKPAKSARALFRYLRELETDN